MMYNIEDPISLQASIDKLKEGINVIYYGYSYYRTY